MLGKGTFRYSLIALISFIFFMAGDYPLAAPTQAVFPSNDGVRINSPAPSGKGYVIYFPAIYYNSGQAVSLGIATQPANLVVSEGEKATFSVAASGTSLTYQWERWNEGTWEKVTAGSGGTTASYTTAPTTAGDNGTQFRCAVSNAAGIVFSDAALLTVQVSPVITIQPLDLTVTAGQTATFIVSAVGTTPLSYQWRRQESGGGAWTIVGENSPSFTTAPTSGVDNGSKFQVLVANAAGKVLSVAVTLTLGYMPDWRGVPYGPFDLVPYSSLTQPVLTASNVTDITASFVADPFLFYEKGLWYLFFEALETSKGLGRIGLATSPDGLHWEYQKVVLKEDFHLSFPQVFSSNGQHYMIPETFQTDSVRLYEATQFPEGWKLVSTLVQGRPFVDPQIIRYNNTWWLFVNDTTNGNGYLYYSDNLTHGWAEHPQSPVVRGTDKSRGGGRVFAYNGGIIIRLAQDDSLIYGRSVRAFQVDALTGTTYSEHEIPQSPLLIGGDSSWNQVVMHHLDPWWAGNGWICAVDGAGPDTDWSIGIYTSLPPAVPKSSWTLTYVDSQELVAQNGAAVNAFDGNVNTIWNTKWKGGSPPPPHEIRIDLGSKYNIGGFSYLPRQDGGENGRIGQYEFYVSMDGVNWGSPATAGTFANDATEKKVSFPQKAGRVIRLRALTEVNGNPWTAIAEINVFGTLLEGS